MRYLVFSLLLVLGACSPAYTSSFLNSGTFADVWEDFSELSGKAVESATSSDRDSRTVLEFFTARQPRYVRLLKDAQNILANSETDELFEDINALLEKNRELEQEAVELTRMRITAPAESLNPFTKTRERIDRRLEKSPQDIAENLATVTELKHRILAQLRTSGFMLSLEELDYFLISAEGSDLMRLMNIADNMKKIQTVIEQQLQADRNNVDLAKIYTGMYLVSLDAYGAAHDTAMENIASYREKVKEIATEASKNHREAQKLYRNADQAERVHLKSNLVINEQTMEVARMYDNLLVRRCQSLERSRAAVTRKADLARNTYRTIANGSNLIALVNTSSDEFQLIMNFEMPELKTIYDSALLGAFTEISARIRREE